MSDVVSLIVERLPEGGFIVTDASWRSDPSRYCPPLFASSSMGEALAFIAKKLEPEKNVALAGAGLGSQQFQRPKVLGDLPVGSWTGA